MLLPLGLCKQILLCSLKNIAQVIHLCTSWEEDQFCKYFQLTSEDGKQIGHCKARIERKMWEIILVIREVYLKIIKTTIYVRVCT